MYVAEKIMYITVLYYNIDIYRCSVIIFIAKLQLSKHSFSPIESLRIG